MASPRPPCRPLTQAGATSALGNQTSPPPPAPAVGPPKQKFPPPAPPPPKSPPAPKKQTKSGGGGGPPQTKNYFGFPPPAPRKGVSKKKSPPTNNPPGFFGGGFFFIFFFFFCIVFFVGKAAGGPGPTPPPPPPPAPPPPPGWFGVVCACPTKNLGPPPPPPPPHPHRGPYNPTARARPYSVDAAPGLRGGARAPRRMAPAKENTAAKSQPWCPANETILRPPPNTLRRSFHGRKTQPKNARKKARKKSGERVQTLILPVLPIIHSHIFRNRVGSGERRFSAAVAPFLYKCKSRQPPVFPNPQVW